ncbi:hypothetical protein EP073_11550 [Geovibrio thiophilus]|uniref:Uncharacterized protein n=1 Tax=Geovibrio thiophilus TaxID=139438 RepID=A0A410K110_9BACT|nr:hypothetical protein [Geovibrio thiophilus]QAR34015.1 hypothetical protein EP073_11550 [Geovibrio thiophilus]
MDFFEKCKKLEELYTKNSINNLRKNWSPVKSKLIIIVMLIVTMLLFISINFILFQKISNFSIYLINLAIWSPLTIATLIYDSCIKDKIKSNIPIAKEVFVTIDNEWRELRSNMFVYEVTFTEKTFGVIFDDQFISDFKNIDDSKKNINKTTITFKNSFVSLIISFILIIIEQLIVFSGKIIGDKEIALFNILLLVSIVLIAFFFINRQVVPIFSTVFRLK